MGRRDVLRATLALAFCSRGSHSNSRSLSLQDAGHPKCVQDIILPSGRLVRMSQQSWRHGRERTRQHKARHRQPATAADATVVIYHPPGSILPQLVDVRYGSMSTMLTSLLLCLSRRIICARITGPMSLRSPLDSSVCSTGCPSETDWGAA